MFSRKKPEPPKKRNHDLSQFGLTDIPDDFDPSAGYGDDDNDSDLEAELAAIAGSGGVGKPKAKPKPKLLPANELDQMIAASLKDVGSDDDDDDEPDDDLLGELHAIAGGDEPEDVEPSNTPKELTPDEPNEPTLFLPTTTVDTLSVIRTRIEMYKQAEIAAKAAGESAKARRFGRGLKTLNDQLKQATAGKPINVDDIPPEVSVKPAAPQPDQTLADSPTTPAPSRPAPPPPPAAPAPIADTQPASKSPSEAEKTTEATTDDIPAPAKEQNPLIAQMRTRQAEYKSAALQYKRAGDTASALQFLKIVKQFDVVVKMCEEGKEVDLSDMPPPPEQFKAFMEQMQATAEAGSGTTATSTEDTDKVPPAAIISPEPPTAPAAATSMLEALQQRLEKYKSVETAAKEEGNSSKARRFGRIVKQYEDAIKQYKAKRPVAFDELPVPPGFGPLPTENAASATTSPPPPPPSSTPTPTISKPTSPSIPSATGTGTASTNASATPETTPTGTPTPPKRGSPSQRIDLTTRVSGNQQKNNLAEQQMKILLDRQKEFKVAALEAKNAGEIEQAKEYLKIYKGFDSLLNAASSGLPVDLSTLPLPPSQRENLEASFAIVATEDCDPDDDISDIGVRIEEQLAKQLMMCKNTRDHHKAMGDVAGTNRFENLAVTVQKDLDLVRYCKRKNLSLPKFHYEKRSFNIVHCNTDLTDSELEIVVVRGIHYNVPNAKEVDTYVKLEFPLLNDESFKTKTNLIKDTDSPDYDQRFKVEIQRGNRQFQRIFKRHGVKFEVYSRGGFLRSDVLIGTVNVKLQPLETKCEIHDTFDLMEGRKTVGGKLEIKIRVRNPILTKQMEHINEKWLVLDA